MRDLSFYAGMGVIALILILAMVGVFAVEDVLADTQPEFPRYAVLNSLFSPVANTRSDDSPVCMNARDFCYEGQWCEDWGKRNPLNYYVVDWETRLIYQHHNRQPGGDLWVMVWGSYELGSDGNPHPVGGWWCDE